MLMDQGTSALIARDKQRVSHEEEWEPDLEVRLELLLGGGLAVLGSWRFWEGFLGCPWSLLLWKVEEVGLL